MKLNTIRSAQILGCGALAALILVGCSGSNKFGSLQQQQQEAIRSTKDVTLQCQLGKEACEALQLQLSLEGFDVTVTEPQELNVSGYNGDALVTVASDANAAASLTWVSSSTAHVDFTRIYDFEIGVYHKAVKGRILKWDMRLFQQGLSSSYTLTSDGLLEAISVTIAAALGHTASLTAKLHDQNQNYRRYAAEWMGKIGNPDFLSSLRKQLAEEEIEEVKREIRKAISSIPNEST